MNYFKQTKKAFGLVEVLLASTIIITVISSFVFVSQGVLTATGRTADRIQAASLAAEGIEMVRQIRDTSWIDQKNTTTWGKWVWSIFSETPNPAKFYDPNFSSGKYFLITTTNGRDITLNGATYRRKLAITKIPFTSGMMSSSTTSKKQQLKDLSYKVTAEVTSVDDSKIIVTISEILTNWRPNF
ncbi:hypothetical protein COT78_01170 [Candidatus Berkelbacteria bacterium CG10_big_fil_rev_8_21_14_0_10_43_13]|uniref:Uncharacterized protein n=1 Tax=Candidatus Berkelbacteria bacterium CG10_big_fil_rev_8_21_14_0_10_43_13 TaxID=1974514 RepID=A0A2H0W6Y0_9BACT|nr:MAG: hypothetical protein COT78_01170 [Candidatus Berkelbacteria bacterium CG10_big_fil_rev_8_21_14_0_10_43_13]